ncbi:MAG: hypothetical protein D6805_04945 [Planctomycetota bacterium]|nr:MAG: hypothetical protein D6805_04945 [Planctomycetota bacterium]
MFTRRSYFYLFFCFCGLSFSLVWGQERFLCENCKRWVPASAKRCPFCGIEFGDEVECTNCNRVIPASAKRCPFCGVRFQDSSGVEAERDSRGKRERGDRVGEGEGSSSGRFGLLDLLEYEGYFRVYARTDFGKGAKTLGWWNLYGRLMNERPWFTFGISQKFLRQRSETDPGVRVYGRIEGDSFRVGDEKQGSLSSFSLTQIYLEVVNIPYRHFVVQLGTLWYNMGYIGIYDWYVAQSFWETVGVRAGMRYRDMEWFVALGDSGYDVYQRRKQTFEDAGYDSVPTVGGLFKVKLGEVWLGSSVMLRYEFGDSASKNAPRQTDSVDYRDVLRGDVLERYLDANPSDPNGDFFPASRAVDDFSWRWTFWLGFGGVRLGGIRLRWNDFSVSLEKKPADQALRFSANGVTKDVYISRFTDERYELLVLDESYWELSSRVDMVMGIFFSYAWDGDNRYRPDDQNRLAFSILFRPQIYLTDYFHLLNEVSFAVERSLIGNRYREHFDSLTTNTDGVFDPEGLEWGDTDIKYTLQFKTGLVFNPFGKGIYNRPSIRLLFGVQYSNVHAAFKNSYEESLARQNLFNARKDLHWHYMISLEVEHWFGNY